MGKKQATLGRGGATAPASLSSWGWRGERGRNTSVPSLRPIAYTGGHSCCTSASSDRITATQDALEGGPENTTPRKATRPVNSARARADRQELAQSDQFELNKRSPTNRQGRQGHRAIQGASSSTGGQGGRCP